MLELTIYGIGFFLCTLLIQYILQQHPRSEEKSFKKFATLAELQEFSKTITEFDMCI